MYAKESHHQNVMVNFYEKMTLATLELLEKGRNFKMVDHFAVYFIQVFGM